MILEMYKGWRIYAHYDAVNDIATLCASKLIGGKLWAHYVSAPKGESFKDTQLIKEYVDNDGR